MILPIRVEMDGGAGPGDSDITLRCDDVGRPEDRGPSESERSYTRGERGRGRERGGGESQQREEDAGSSLVLTLHLQDLVTQVGLDVVLTVRGQNQT